MANSSQLPPNERATLLYGDSRPRRPLDFRSIVVLLARLVVGGCFIYMAYHKIGHPVSFLKQIHLYNMVPEHKPVLINGMAAALPWVEMVCGILLLLGIAVRGSSLLLLLMLAVFTTAIFLRAMSIYHASAIAFCAIKFDCGCGGGEQIICHKIPENLGLMVLSLIALLSRTDRFCAWRNLVPSGQSPWRIEGY